MSPRIFIGSSSEAGVVVDEIKRQLSSKFTIFDWRFDAIKLGSVTFQSILECLKTCDFTIFVFAKDDKINFRKVDFHISRDNTIFEAGMSFGMISPDRTFIIPEDSTTKSKLNPTKLKVLSDLAGFTLTSSYDLADLSRTITAISQQISNRIEDLGLRTKSDFLQTRDEIKYNTIKYASDAAHKIIFIGRDLSWAADYANIIEDRVRNGVIVDVFCEMPASDVAQSNVDLLMSKGAHIYQSKNKLDLKLTIIDYEDKSTCRFLLSAKEWLNNKYVYRCEVHNGNSSPMLWKALTEHCRVLRDNNIVLRKG